MRTIHVWSDGACSGNPGPGGYSAIVYDDKDIYAICGYNEATTNNRMELTGFLNGIGTTILNNKDTQYKIIAHTDSKYVENAINCGWLIKWEKKDYVGIKNDDLWRMVYKVLLSKSTNIEVKWCKGHSGIAQNEEADRVAVYAMENKLTPGTIIELVKG